VTQRRKSKKTEAEPRRVNRRTFLAGAGAAACVGAGLWLRRKKFSKQDKTKAEKQPVENPALPAGEWRAVWVSYLEWAAMDFSSADSFRAGCVQMLENCAGLGLNTVLAQVRPFGDALYKSQLFPWSHLCTGVQGQDPGFDPLDILLQEAHGRGLSVEAWLNPYRLRSSAAMPPNSPFLLFPPHLDCGFPDNILPLESIQQGHIWRDHASTPANKGPLGSNASGQALYDGGRFSNAQASLPYMIHQRFSISPFKSRFLRLHRALAR